MKVTDIIKKLPTGSPVVDLLKLATILAATVLADKIDAKRYYHKERNSEDNRYKSGG